MIKNRTVNITILAILLSSTNSFANTPVSAMAKTASTEATSNTGDTSQKIIDDFYAYAGSIKPEIREEIKKYREEIVAINKKKRDLYNSLSQEAQNFLAEQQKYKKRISASEETQQNNQEDDSSKDKPQ